MTSDRIAFINWLLWMRKVSPELYALFRIQHPEIISALNDSRLGFSFDWGSILDTGIKFVQSALPIYQQQKQFKQQLELAKVQAQMPTYVPQATPTYAPVAVSPTTPTTTQAPAVNANGQQVLEIRIDKGQVAEVKQQAQEVKGIDWAKYIPFLIGGAFLLAKVYR